MYMQKKMHQIEIKKSRKGREMYTSFSKWNMEKWLDSLRKAGSIKIKRASHVSF